MSITSNGLHVVDNGREIRVRCPRCGAEARIASDPSDWFVMLAAFAAVACLGVFVGVLLP